MPAESHGRMDNRRAKAMGMQAEDECGGVRTRHANAFDMKDTRAGLLNVDVWHNDITKIGGATIGSLKRIAKPIDRIVNTWLQAWLGDDYSARLLSQMNMPKPTSSLLLDFSSIIGPLFFVWLVQLPLPYAVVQLVYEKEKRLRTMMKIHGLENGAPPAVPWQMRGSLVACWANSFHLYISILLFHPGSQLHGQVKPAPGAKGVYACQDT